MLGEESGESMILQREVFDLHPSCPCSYAISDAVGELSLTRFMHVQHIPAEGVLVAASTRRQAFVEATQLSLQVVCGVGETRLFFFVM